MIRYYRNTNIDFAADFFNEINSFLINLGYGNDFIGRFNVEFTTSRWTVTIVRYQIVAMCVGANFPTSVIYGSLSWFFDLGFETALTLEYVYANILTGDYFIAINGENGGFTLDFNPVFIVPIAAEIEPLFNFGISISSLATYETQIRVAFASIPARTRLTIQWLEIYFFNFFAFNGLEVVIQDFSSLVINDASFITLLGAIEYDGVALTSDEISAEVFEWDFYQQIIYNFITSPAVGIDLTVDSVSTTAIKRLITRNQISRQNSLERVLEIIQFRVGLFLRFFVTADFDFSFGRRIEIAFSGNQFSNAAVCMAGISQVIAPAETVTTFITDYETVFDGFISAEDFLNVFNIQLDIEAYYQTFYRVVRLNVYQMYGQRFFNNFVTDVDTQTLLRQFYLYLCGAIPMAVGVQMNMATLGTSSRLIRHP